MRKLLLTSLVLLIAISVAYSQNTSVSKASTNGASTPKIRKAKAAKKDLPEEAKKFVEKVWDSHIAKCGDSFFFVREDEKMKQTLFEVKGINYETSSDDVSSKDGTLWSGNSTARFQSYRQMEERSHTWNDWIPGGAESFLFAYDRKYEWMTIPLRFPSTTCMDVKVFTGEIASGKMLPDEMLDIPINLVDGRVLKLKEQEGVVLLYLWASWCGPCRMQDPELVKLQNKYSSRGFTVIGLDIDPEPEKVIKDYGEKRGINFPLALAEPKLYANLLSISRLGAIPQSFLISNGKLIEIFKGYHPNKTTEAMANAIEEALAAQQK